MMHVAHLILGARGFSRLVRDDHDRFALLGRVVAALGDDLLAYCVMDTHLHVVARGTLAEAALAGALRLYARAFNARHREEGPLLRGPIRAIPAPSEFELGRQIRYVHANPLDTTVPIVATPVAFEWSSARRFAGLSAADFPNVAGAVEILGDEGRRFLPEPEALVDLEPALTPRARPEVILRAAAQTFGVDPLRVAGPERSPVLARARAVYMNLGRLESFCGPQLAPLLGRTRQCANQIAAAHADARALRIARTLLLTPELNARLGSRTFPAGKSGAVSLVSGP
jgi:hypothetical protein